MSTGDTRPQYYETHLTEEEERFLVRAPAEIVQILRNACSRAAMLTAYFGEGGDFALTSLLEVAPERGLLLFDIPAQRSLVPRMVESTTITFTTHLDGIKIKFQVDSLENVEDGGREALASGLPEGVVRLQRREYFRVGCPMSSPPKCTIPYTKAGQTLKAEFDVADLSLGGLSLMDRQQRIVFEPGNVYKDCTLALPGETPFTTGLEVRNMHPVEVRGGQISRMGCRFVQPPAEGITRVQRYCMRIERERNARFGKG